VLPVKAGGYARVTPCIELRHNSVACAPSRLTNPLSWIAPPTKRKTSTPMAPESDVRSAVGRPARATAGRAHAATHGTRSIPEECARSVSTRGLQPSVSRVSSGRRTRSGMRLREKEETVK